MWHDKYLTSLKKTGSSIQATSILRFCLSNLNCCNIGITDDRDSLCMPLKWAQVA
jgi:hypothetical protein